MKPLEVEAKKIIIAVVKKCKVCQVEEEIACADYGTALKLHTDSEWKCKEHSRPMYYYCEG